MKYEQLEVQPQTIYAGHGGKIMPDVTSVENTTQQADSSPGTRRPLAENEQEVQEVREGIKDYVEDAKLTSDQRNASRRQQRGPVARSSKQASQQEQAQTAKKPLEPTAYFSQVPSSVATEIAEFCADAQGNALADLSTRFLTREYLRLYRKADETGVGFGFLSEINNQLKSRGVHADQIAKVGFRQARTPPSVAGSAPEIPSNNINNAQIRAQIDIANGLLHDAPNEDIADQLDVLQKTLDRLAFLSVPDADGNQKIEAQNRIRERLVELRRQVRTEHPQRIHDQQERQAPPPVVLTRQETGDLSVDSYQVREVKAIAQEVQSTLEAPTAQRQVDSNYLRDKIRDLSTLRQTGNPSPSFNEEAGKLMSKLQGIKEILNAREGEKRLERQQADYSTYGEMRLLAEDKKDLISLALQDTPEADRILEERFNRIFIRADARSNDDWSEALGTAGQYEMTDFLMALQSVASGRITFEQRQLTRAERELLNRKVRKLGEEQKLRQFLHNITYYANRGFGTEDITKVVANFSAEDADLAYKQTGVVQISHFFENAMNQIIAKNAGYLPAKAMINDNDGNPGEVEKLVRQQIDEAKRIGILPSNMEDWEISRAISLARGMGITSGRFIEIVARSGVPRGAPLTSWWANDIVSKIAFFKQVTRYNVGFERNKFLAYKLEGGSKFWSTKELTEIANLQVGEIMDRWVNEDEQNRYIDTINPFRTGSIFTQTGWRYINDEVTLSTAISRLLKDDPLNPLIGVGMWIEKERKNLSSNDPRVAERAKAIIQKNLELAAKITPLKLFYNMMGLKQSVLRNHYGNAISEQSKGQIVIKSEQLQDDLGKLALLQEHIVKKRADAYKDFLDGKAAKPDLWSTEYTTLDYDKLVTAPVGTPEREQQETQRDRVKLLAKQINDEFNLPSHKDRLMSNLKDKGWKVPFIFGTEDLPYNLYSFTDTGSTSWKRRWGDINSAANAAGVYEKELLMNMTNFQSQDDIVKVLNNIYQTLRGHDEGVVREVMTRTIEGITKFYKKDWVNRLPAGLGTLSGFVGGQASYAQVAFGRGQMAWDELDVQAFMHRVQAAGLVTKDQYNELKKKTGGEWWNLTGAMFRTAVPLGLLALIYMLLQEELEAMKKAA